MNNDLGLRVHAASTLCLYAVTAEVVPLVFCVNNDLGLQHPLSLHCTSAVRQSLNIRKFQFRTENV